jgi:hypothetical protein
MSALDCFAPLAMTALRAKVALLGRCEARTRPSVAKVLPLRFAPIASRAASLERASP